MPNVCPICNNPLRQYGKDFYVCEVCETYFDKNENIVLTEQEWLQTCDTEQLAELLKKHMNCNFCPMNLKCEDMRDCMEHIKVWLKQPHTTEVEK